MEIDTLEGIQLGGITQWMRVRGADATNPVLLLMQQGPGLPMINEARRWERLLGLEETFTVVYWDQRGTGLSSPSLRRNSSRFVISVARMVDDTVTLLELLRDRFGGKTFVAGFSFGATFAAYAAVRRPELVAALVAAGMDIDIPAAENNAYAFALGAARRRGNRRAIRQLEAIGPPPHTNVKQFVMAQGRLDQVAPGEATQRFHDALTAPSKQLVWFEKSAHTPHLEEPAKFRDLLMTVTANRLANP